MALKIQVNVEKMFDRGPQHGFLEVQVNFEEKVSPAKGVSFASVIISLPKGEAGNMTFDQIRATALSRALSFMEECVKSCSSK